MANYKIKRLLVVFAMPSPPPMLLSAIPPTVAHSIGLYREFAIAIQDEVGDSNGGNFMHIEIT